MQSVNERKQFDLTVAICMYNASRYIEDTLLCIINQDFQDFDLLILNDCSTDDSICKIKSFFTKNPRQYKIINLPENKGLCYGRYYVENKVLTKYLLFIDSDDCPYNTLVRKLYTKITSDHDLMAVGCYLKYIDSNGNDMDGGIFLGVRNKIDFYKKASAEKLIFMQPTAIYNREIALSVGGHCIEGFPDGKPRYQDLCEDLDLWTRMSDLYINKKAIVVVPEILCGYRKHESALSSNTFGMFLRMKHIKQNLKLRRANKLELTFKEFFATLSKKDQRILINKSKSADALKKGYYQLRNRKFAFSFFYIIKSIWFNPKYIYEKINCNFIHN